VIDDLWKLSKPRGEGGPWKDTLVQAGQPSDPYLMTGYDHKQMRLSHKEDEPVRFTVEVELTGNDHWVAYKEFEVEAGQTMVHNFPDNFNAYWVRFRTSKDTQATAQLHYS
jgi:hypothetical protein